MSTVLEHNEDGSATSTASSFTPTFGNPVDAGLDASSFVKGVDGCGVGTAHDGPSINSEVVYRLVNFYAFCHFIQICVILVGYIQL